MAMYLSRILAIFLFLSPAMVWAHAPNEHYVWLKINETSLGGDIEIATRDLKNLLGYDLDPEVPVTAEALAPYADRIEDYVAERFGISSDGKAFDLEIRGVRPWNMADANSAMVEFVASDGGNPVPKFVTIRDEILFEYSARHRGITLILEDLRTGEKFHERQALVFSPFNTEQELNLDDPPRLMSRLAFIWQGMLHIFIGIDHILFLISLLFTAVLIRSGNKWEPVESLGSASLNVFKIVTLFTIAHSVTLFLAGLGYLNLPSRAVESIIALSIVVVALNNLWGRFDSKKLWIILVFGLFHGLGFATVMAELPFRMNNLLWVVVFFNIGVELGQIAIVAVVFPVLYWLRNSRMYVPVMVTGGSLVVAAIAGYWFVERALGLG